MLVIEHTNVAVSAMNGSARAPAMICGWAPRAVPRCERCLSHRLAATSNAVSSATLVSSARSRTPRVWRHRALTSGRGVPPLRADRHGGRTGRAHRPGRSLGASLHHHDSPRRSGGRAGGRTAAARVPPPSGRGWVSRGAIRSIFRAAEASRLRAAVVRTRRLPARRRHLHGDPRHRGAAPRSRRHRPLICAGRTVAAGGPLRAGGWSARGPRAAAIGDARIGRRARRGRRRHNRARCDRRDPSDRARLHGACLRAR
jgi:hypothetical protein